MSVVDDAVAALALSYLSQDIEPDVGKHLFVLLPKSYFTFENAQLVYDPSAMATLTVPDVIVLETKAPVVLLRTTATLNGVAASIDVVEDKSPEVPFALV